MKHKEPPRLGLVVPVYNEESLLEYTIHILDGILTDLIKQTKIQSNSFIFFVDDGSSDTSWKILSRASSNNSDRFKGIKLSKNHGHQNALLSGLLYAKEFSDCVISLDADLQDDASLIPQFIDAYLEGNDIVYGIRDCRDTDTLFKRKSAELYYRALKKIGAEIKYNHADYRLMSKRALDQLSSFGESNVFLRGVIPLIGLPSKNLHYMRQKRMAGETKYPLKKMIGLAIEGITSFSNAPLRLISILGFSVFTFSIMMSLYVLFQDLILHNVVRGWSSLLLSTYALSGIQLLCLGVIGEYIGKIYTETKKRPRYIIDEILP